MKDQNKTKAQLIVELTELRQRVSESEQSETGRMRSDEALQESEAKLRAVVEGSLQGILVHQKTKPLFVNKAYANILGYETPDEILSMDSVVPLIASYEQERLLTYQEARLKGISAPEYYEYDALCKDGSIVTLQHAVTMINWDNEPAVLSAVLDITERVRAEAALRTEKEFTDMALDAQLDTFFLFDPATNKALRWNRTFRDFSGYTDEEIARLPAPASYYSPKELEQAGIFIQKILKEGSGTIELELICKDGRKVPTEYRVSVINDDQGEPKYIISIGRDITERRQFEQSLRESEKLLRQVIDTSPYSIFVKDRDGRYMLVNKKMAESHNTSPEAMVGTTDLSVAKKWLTNPEEIERFRASERDVTDRKKTQFTKEEKFTFRNGTERWFQTVKTPISLKDNPNCLMGIAVDITERVRAEESLRESEAKFRNVVESSPMGMHMYHLESDERLVFVDANPAANKILGIDNSQFIGKTIEEAFPPLATTEVPERYRRAATQGEFWFTEQITYEDEEIAGAFEVHAFQTEPGKMVAMFLDITERKRAEDALRESEARYRTLFEHANDAIFLENENDEIIDVNRQACEMMGYIREELLQMTVPELQAPVVRGEKGTVIKRELEKYSGGLLESINLHRDGTQIPVEVSTAAIPGRDAGLVLAIVRDITKRKQAEAERKTLISELEAKNAELERFAYTVSHDLKSPLITINGFVGYLEEDATSGNMERLRGDIQRIQNAVDKMHQLLKELLELSRIGRLMNPPEEIPFEELARDALDIVHGQLEARGVAVTLEPNLPTVYGDRQRLVEVLQNLIDNAAKCMGEQSDPRIEIGQRGEDDSKFVFYVKDNGIGIAPEYHEKIFGLFEKLDAKTEGTGIGLALVKRIVEFHGGRIWVESASSPQGEAGKGSTFYFTLERGDEAGL